jgi:hypothetical protein
VSVNFGEAMLLMFGVGGGKRLVYVGGPRNGQWWSGGPCPGYRPYWCYVVDRYILLHEGFVPTSPILLLSSQ